MSLQEKMDFEVRCASAKLFAGQYYDSETGLHYNYFRTYDPATGRYERSDPIGLAGGLNTYSYVGSNPLSYSDPYGLVCGSGACVLAAAGTVGTVVGLVQGVSTAIAGGSFADGFVGGFGYGFSATAIGILSGLTTTGAVIGIAAGTLIDAAYSTSTAGDLLTSDNETSCQ